MQRFDVRRPIFVSLINNFYHLIFYTGGVTPKNGIINRERLSG